MSRLNNKVLLIKLVNPHMVQKINRIEASYLPKDFKKIAAKRVKEKNARAERVKVKEGVKV